MSRNIDREESLRIAAERLRLKKEREEREEFANSQIRSVTFEMDLLKSTDRD